MAVICSSRCRVVTNLLQLNIIDISHTHFPIPTTSITSHSEVLCVMIYIGHIVDGDIADLPRGCYIATLEIYGPTIIKCNII